MFAFSNNQTIKILLILAIILLPVSKLMANTHNTFMLNATSEHSVHKSDNAHHETSAEQHMNSDHNNNSACDKKCGSCAFCSVTVFENIIFSLSEDSITPPVYNIQMSGIIPEVATYPPRH